MIGRKIKFRNYTGIVYDKIRSGNQDMYLVKREKEDLDSDININTPDVMLIYPEDIITIY